MWLTVVYTNLSCVCELFNIKNIMHKGLKNIIKKTGISSKYIALATNLSEDTIKKMRSKDKRYNFTDIHYNKLITHLKNYTNKL